MRPTLTARALALAVGVAFSLAACGGTEEPASAPTATGSSTAPQTPEDAPVSEAPEVAAAVESTSADAEEFAVELEQVFFRTGYPDDLAGALVAARRTGLMLEPGNTIAGYTFDADASEFRLCVENTSGAYATYDTRPMSMRDSGLSGGCP